MRRGGLLIVLLAVSGILVPRHAALGEAQAVKEDRASGGQANRLYLPIPASPESYNRLCGAVVSALWRSGLHITEMSPFEGRIEAVTRYGFVDGSGSIERRLREMAPTHRHRAVVQIQPADGGGYWVMVIAYKQVEGKSPETWVPSGEDVHLERQLAARIYKSMMGKARASAAPSPPAAGSPIAVLKQQWARWGLSCLAVTWDELAKEVGDGEQLKAFYISYFK
jgi:hypothetical protein